MTLLKILLIILAIYLIVSRTSKYWLPYIFKKIMSKMANKMNPGNFESEGDTNNEVTLRTGNQKKKKRFKSDEGEYTDFEEIN